MQLKDLRSVLISSLVSLQRLLLLCKKLECTHSSLCTRIFVKLLLFYAGFYIIFLKSSLPCSVSDWAFFLDFIRI